MTGVVLVFVGTVALIFAARTDREGWFLIYTILSAGVYAGAYYLAI